MQFKTFLKRICKVVLFLLPFSAKLQRNIPGTTQWGGVNIYKSAFYNFHLLPFSQAKKLPIIVYRHTRIKCKKTHFIINCEPSFGLIKLGIPLTDIVDRKKETLIVCNGKIEFRGRAIIGKGSKWLISNTGNLTIGENTNITALMNICCEHEITIQNNCMFSWGITIIDTDYHPIYNNEGMILNYPRPITVGDNVWIGCNSMILKGVDIADGSIISAGSVIRSSLSSKNSIYGMRSEIICRLKDGIKWSKDCL